MRVKPYINYLKQRQYIINTPNCYSHSWGYSFTYKKCSDPAIHGFTFAHRFEKWGYLDILRRSRKISYKIRRFSVRKFGNLVVRQKHRMVTNGRVLELLHSSFLFSKVKKLAQSLLIPILARVLRFLSDCLFSPRPELPSVCYWKFKGNKIDTEGCRNHVHSYPPSIFEVGQKPNFAQQQFVIWGASSCAVYKYYLAVAANDVEFQSDDFDYSSDFLSSLHDSW